MNLFIIIPCYNEEGNIKHLLEEIKEVSKTTSYDWHLVVVNDCSTDNTLSEAKKYSEVVVLNLPLNLGVGGAVQTGLLYALSHNADFAVKVDGDGQHNPNEIIDLLKPIIKDESDISIGSRFLKKGGGFKSSFFRRLGINIIQLFVYLLSGEKISDPTSGYRAYNKKAIVFMSENYPSFDYPEPEEIVLANKYELRLAEVPVEMRDRKSGKSSISFYGSFYYMLKVLISMFFIKLRKREISCNQYR